MAMKYSKVPGVSFHLVVLGKAAHFSIFMGAVSLLVVWDLIVLVKEQTALACCSALVDNSSSKAESLSPGYQSLSKGDFTE